MSNWSFSISSKHQLNHLLEPIASFSDGAAAAAADSSSTSRNYVMEFSAGALPVMEFKIKPIAPILNTWCPNKKLKNLPNLPQISESNNSTFQFELDPGTNMKSADNPFGYGLNLRQSAETTFDDSSTRGETISEMELRRLREDLEMLPEGPGVDEYTDVPVEGFGAALLSGYGWKEGRGIGCNAKEDVKVCEFTRKAGRRGLGFTGDLLESGIYTNGSPTKNVGNGSSEKKTDDQKEKKGFDIGKEVRIVNGKEMGTLGVIVDIRHGGELFVLVVSRSRDKVEVHAQDVVLMGSVKEKKFLKELNELSIKERDVSNGGQDESISKKGGNDKKSRVDRENWLRNNIRVRVISECLKDGRLFLKKGVVVDVVGPGICDILTDESLELVQGVDQELMEAALPKRGGAVLVLYGRHKGVYGSMVEQDSDKETGVVQDADTQEMLEVKLEQIAEYTGDPSDIGY